MIKRSLYFGNPAYLSLKSGQLVIKRPGSDGDMPDFDNPKTFTETVKTIPIEDIGVVVLDNQQITATEGLLEALLENNCAVVTCDCRHMPVGLLLPLYGNTIQTERYLEQINASLPLKKQLWQQTVQSKIKNQAAVLKYSTGFEAKNMLAWAETVRSGDTGNLEGRAAAYYWKTVFVDNPKFVRDGNGVVNTMLNYGYAILRAIVARALVGAGLLPTLGIHHHNRYDAYCLADDIMEPYRPYVDKQVIDIIGSGIPEEFDTNIKKILLELPVKEVCLGGTRRPLMIAVSQTVSSLQKCFSGQLRKLTFPEME